MAEKYIKMEICVTPMIRELELRQRWRHYTAKKLPKVHWTPNYYYYAMLLPSLSLSTSSTTTTAATEVVPQPTNTVFCFSEVVVAYQSSSSPSSQIIFSTLNLGDTIAKGIGGKNMRVNLRRSLTSLAKIYAKTSKVLYLSTKRHYKWADTLYDNNIAQ